MSAFPELPAAVSAGGGCPVLHGSAADKPVSRAAGLVALLYGVVSYALFAGVFVYLVGFVEDVAVPRSINRSIDAPLAQTVIVDLGLVGLFGLQHSVMARPGFKRWWTRYVPASVERSTYLLFANVTLALMFWQWRTIDTVVWHVDWVPARIALEAVGAIGWGIAFASTFMIDHFDLFGLRQVWTAWKSKPSNETAFRTVLFYRLVRHPLMLGFLIAFWVTPAMTGGHLVFAAAMTVYILIALRFEERDLVDALGEPYRRYRQRVPMLFPRAWR